MLTTLFLNFREAQPKADQFGSDTNPFSVTFPDAARAIRKCLETDLSTLPSRCEIFHITTDTPHGRYSNATARRLLGWAPQDSLEGYWRKRQS